MAQIVPFMTDGSGAGSAPVGIPAAPAGIGTFYRAQIGVIDPTAPQGWFFSHGLEFAVCAP
jgi:hypothetical protein